MAQSFLSVKIVTINNISHSIIMSDRTSIFEILSSTVSPLTQPAWCFHSEQALGWSPYTGAAVDICLIILIAAAIDTAHTTALSTGNGHWILQQIQTNQASELVLLYKDFSCSHFANSRKYSDTQTQSLNEIKCRAETEANVQSEKRSECWSST